MAKVWIGRQDEYNFDSVKEALYEGLTDTGIWRNVTGLKVLLKPNLTSASDPLAGKTTHPMVVEALADLLTDAGVGELTIAESSQVGTDTNLAVKRCGYDRVVRKYGFVDLKETASVELTVNGYILDRVKVFKPILEADLIISAAKLKTIFACPFSLCAKNMKGAIPDKEKKRFHRIGLNKSIADLLSVLPPISGVIDGIMGLSLTTYRQAGLLFVGSDPLCTDTIAALVMGITIDKTNHISLAAKRGIGTIRFDDIEVSGVPLDSIEMKPFKTAAGLEDLRTIYGATIIDGNPCSGCVGVVKLALESLRDQGFSAGISLAMGPDLQGHQLDSVDLVIGNCAAAYKARGLFVPGCPSISTDIVDAIKNAMAPD